MSLCPVRLEVWATFTSPCCQTWLSRSLETTACCWRVQASPSGGFTSTHLIPVFHCNPNLWSYWFAQWVRAGFILELLVWHESIFSTMLPKILQGTVYHRPQRRGETHEHQRPACGSVRRGDPSLGEGIPVRGNPRRGVSGQLDSGVPDGQFLHV